MTLYLLDANTLIRAHADYYPIDRIRPFWPWLLEKASAGVIKVPAEIYGEVDRSTDLLGQWLSRKDVRSELTLQERTSRATVQHVIEKGYAIDLTAHELIKIGKDPFLIAAAIVAPHDRVVVTREHSKPSKIRANRKVPDVCAKFGLRSITDFELWRVLDFRVP